MSTINIGQECGCFKRSTLENNVTFDNKDDAMMIIKTNNIRDIGLHSNNKAEVTIPNTLIITMMIKK